MHGLVRDLRRFWLPRETPRSPAPPVPLLRIWLLCLAFGAVLAALGWDEEHFMMTYAAVFAMLDDVVAGVRHRWPALVAGLAAGWAADRLMRAGVPDPGSAWGEYSVLAVGTLTALATFASVSRLPRPARS